MAKQPQMLEGGVSETDNLQRMAQSQEFYSFSDYERIQLMEEASPTFKTLPVNSKLDVYNKLVSDYQPGLMNDVLKPLAGTVGNAAVDAAAQTAYQFGAKPLEGLTAGYVDLATPLQGFLESRNAFTPHVANTGNVGFLAGEGYGLGKVAGLAGRGVQTLQKGLQMAPNLPGASMLGNVLTQATSNTVPGMAMRGAAFLGGYDALRRRPGALDAQTQFDPMGRLQAGVTGAAIGGALPFVGSAVAKGVNAVGRDLRNTYEPLKKVTDARPKLVPQRPPLESGKVQQQVRVVKNASDSARVFEDVAQAEQMLEAVKKRMASRKLEVLPGERNISQVITRNQGRLKELAGEVQNIQQAMSRPYPERAQKAMKGRLERLQKEGRKLKADLEFAETARKEYGEAMQLVKAAREGKLTPASSGERVELQGQVVKSGNATRPIEPVKKSAAKPAPKAAATAKETSAAPAQPVKPIDEPPKGSPLSAAVEKIAKPINEARELVAKYDAIPSKRSEQAKAIKAELGDDENLIEVLRTDINPKAGRGVQREISKGQLTYEQVKDAVPEAKRGIAEKLDQAMRDDKIARIEYRAEIIGRSQEAVKVTGKGNAKIEVTDFTPTHYRQTKDGKIMIAGYNQRGHEVSYHLESQGSEIVKVTSVTNRPGFRGTMPNVYKGPREYRIEDVLNRGPRTQEGFIKTSEALNMLESIKDLYKTDTFKSMPAPVQAILGQMKKKGRITMDDIAKLEKGLGQSPKTLQSLCKVFGLSGNV